MLNGAFVVLVILSVSASLEIKLKEPKEDPETHMENSDFMSLSNGQEDGPDKGYTTDGSSEDGIMNMLLRMVSMDSVDKPATTSSDNADILYVTNSKVANHTVVDAGNGIFNLSSKPLKDDDAAVMDAYKWLESEIIARDSVDLGVTSLDTNDTLNENATKELESRLNSDAIYNSLLSQNDTNANVTISTNMTTNSTLIGKEMPQARFGCIVSSLCIVCQQYAILPDNTRVCCLFCSIHPTLVPDRQGGFICSCNY